MAVMRKHWSSPVVPPGPCKPLLLPPASIFGPLGCASTLQPCAPPPPPPTVDRHCGAAFIQPLPPHSFPPKDVEHPGPGQPGAEIFASPVGGAEATGGGLSPPACPVLQWRISGLYWWLILWFLFRPYKSFAFYWWLREARACPGRVGNRALFQAAAPPPNRSRFISHLFSEPRFRASSRCEPAPCCRTRT